jgi:hypothetical protein
MNGSQTAGILLGASALGVVWIAFLADTARRPRWVWTQAKKSKAAWLGIQLVLPLLGTALYVFLARRKVVAAHLAGAAKAVSPWEDAGYHAAGRTSRPFQAPLLPPQPFQRKGHVSAAPRPPLDIAPPAPPAFLSPGDPQSAPAPAPRVIHYPPALWAPDPSGRHQLRYWDGERWTEHVADEGHLSIDPATD